MDRRVKVGAVPALFIVRLYADRRALYHRGLGQSVAFSPITVMAFATLPPQQIAEDSAVPTLLRHPPLFSEDRR